jgi:hypothetical protein
MFSGIVGDTKLKGEDQVKVSLPQIMHLRTGNAPNIEIALQEHEVIMYWLKIEPPFAPLHKDPHWQELMDRMEFPESIPAITNS